jgi:hypothetical protein
MSSLFGGDWMTTFDELAHFYFRAVTTFGNGVLECWQKRCGVHVRSFASAWYLFGVMAGSYRCSLSVRQVSIPFVILRI